MGIVGRWIRYRREQRDRIAELRNPYIGEAEETTSYDAPEPRDRPERDLIASTLPLGEELAPPPPGPTRRDYGTAGLPLNRQSPFYVGFVGALGVLAAYAVVQAIGRLDTTITLLIVAFFLTLALNPIVEALTRRRVRRGWAVALVFLAVVAVFTLIGWVVIPPVAAQGTELAKNATTILDDLLKNPWVQDVDHRYQLVQRIQTEINKRIADGNLWAGIFGGVLDAGKIIAAGIFSALTVLVLTLYFLTSLPAVKQAAYAVVPASRRVRVISLAEEIMRRVGSYAIGQVAVAAINAFFAWIMMSLLDLKFAAVLAVAVGLLGLIPMIGATLGATVVAIVAFFDEPKKALIVIIYFIVYQQIENYAVMPRVMQRTVAVPGAVTVVAALAGGTLLGILGALLAIPFAAGALLIYEEVLVPRQRHH
ncbi:membrane protein [Intrasporangium oryzae NRRL B-24470]|uniref:Membrane protein n=1 Tax=Intrasporangium oryzae NRRL B-24470 TaxID=1386089 RepID=W9G7W0_9MICO|nr:AI-2E family transporter [Intrasporangium oryzae]EWT02281.1 membrane protein [Intrasporangium oryzae NRRL B-24470]